MAGPHIVSTIEPPVATVTLNRPARHNAFDDVMIADLRRALELCGERDEVRVVVLRANGESFSAGGDLAWMRRMADFDDRQNRRDALELAGLMHALDTLPKPVLAVVQGAAYGGGVGLVACSDIAIAGDNAVFCLSEVRLGLIPAVIGPYVLRAMGPRAARRYFLTAERFSALEAQRLGLVHEVVPGHMLEAASRRLVDQLLAGGPAAQARAKALIAEIEGRPPAEVETLTADRIASVRASPEGREGLSAFLEKRPPAWTGR